MAPQLSSSCSNITATITSQAPKQQGTNFQIKKLHLAVGIHSFPQVYGQDILWEQLPTEPSLVGTAGIAGPPL